MGFGLMWVEAIFRRVQRTAPIEYWGLSQSLRKGGCRLDIVYGEWTRRVRADAVTLGRVALRTRTRNPTLSDAAWPGLGLPPAPIEHYGQPRRFPRLKDEQGNSNERLESHPRTANRSELKRSHEIIALSLRQWGVEVDNVTTHCLVRLGCWGTALH